MSVGAVMPEIRALTVNNQNGLRGGLGAGNVWTTVSSHLLQEIGSIRTSLQAIDGLVFTLGLVALGDNGGDAVVLTLAMTMSEKHKNQLVLTSNKPC